MYTTSTSARGHCWSESAWLHLIEQERLIDLGEWADARATPRWTPYDLSVALHLWDRIESIPFAELDRTCFEERLRSVVRAGGRALDRLLKTAQGLGAPGERIDFATTLRSRGRHQSLCRVRLHAEVLASGSLRVTLGTPRDFEHHPTELCAGARRA